MKKLLLILSQIGLLYGVTGQIAPPKRLVIENPNELNAGINLNTHASLLGGFTFKYNKKTTLDKGHSFTLELVNIKHPKELRITNIGSRNNSSFIVGKYNHLLAMRTLYGQQYLFFEKAKDEGVEFSLNVSGGIIWGFEKPYYVLIEGSNTDSSGYHPYSSVRSPDKITGQGNLFMGLSEAKLVPGLSGRLSAVVEFGLESNTPFGIEIGTQLDAFKRKMEILPYAGDKQFFISAFIVAYMGIKW